MAIAAVAMGKDDQGKLAGGHTRIPHRIIPENLVQFGCWSFVVLLDQRLDFRGHTAGEEVRVFILRQLARVRGRRIPNFRDQRAGLLGQGIGASVVHENGGSDADGKWAHGFGARGGDRFSRTCKGYETEQRQCEWGDSFAHGLVKI